MRDNIVTDKGLARRLGREVLLKKRGKGDAGVRGRLVYYPKSFAISQPNELIKLRKGDIVGLKVGSIFANYNPHYRLYEYIGR